MVSIVNKYSEFLQDGSAEEGEATKYGTMLAQMWACVNHLGSGLSTAADCHHQPAKYHCHKHDSVSVAAVLIQSKFG